MNIELRWFTDEGLADLARQLQTERDRRRGAEGRHETMRRMLQAIAFQYRVTVDELIGSSRIRDVVRPRQEFMWLARQTGRWSLPQIGRFLGGRDHTTVIHGVRAHQRRLDQAAAQKAAA